MTHTPEKVKEYLQAVIDPELDITIVDLGLIYDIQFPTEKDVKIIMTLTSMGCPLFGTIHEDIQKALSPLGYTPDTIDIELTFDPPWDEDKMTEKGKAELGIT
jgi:metal-sulfur cluster biosynthetic enzyme